MKNALVILMVLVVILLIGCVPTPQPAPQPPTIITHPVPQIATFGDTVEFSIVVENASSISWQKNGELILNAEREILTLYNVTKADNGMYQAFAENSVGSVSSAMVSLIVRQPPTIITHPVSQTATFGDTVEFSVVVENANSISWQKNGEFILNAVSPIRPQESELSKSLQPIIITYPERSILRLQRVTKDDEGIYQAFAENSVGTVASAEVSLVVKPQEIITAVTTNLANYPLAVNFKNTNVVSVKIGDEVMPIEDYGNFFCIRDLEPGLNKFVLQGQDDSGEGIEDILFVYEITYDQSISTAEDEMLYQPTNDFSATLVINLTKGVIWGALPEIIMLAGTPDGQYVVDTMGNVYQTSDHVLSGDSLPFPETIGTNDLYYSSALSYHLPLFSADSQFCFLENDKYDMASRTIVNYNFPINVNGGYNTVLLNDGLLSQIIYGEWNLADPINDLLTTTSLEFYGKNALTNPSGNFFISTYYSHASGSFYVKDLYSFETIFSASMDDFTGDVAFLPDGSVAFIGAGGNPYYGKGEIAVYNFAENNVVSRYSQFGAYYVKIGHDGLVYARSAYNGRNGTIDHQGIEVLQYDDNTKKLLFIKTYFLGNGADEIGQQFFIKPPVVAPVP